MGRYKRTSTRKSWSQLSMSLAVDEVLEGRMGYLRASKHFEVPRTTLEARVEKIRTGILPIEKSGQKGLGRYKPVFTVTQEEELVEHILSMEKRLFGFTLDNLRSLAFELAERNSISHQFNIEKKKAGKAWLYGFLKRHPNVTLRTAEPTSLARAIGFNRPAVDKFFLLLSEVLKKYNISSDRIYNVDETGIMTVPKKRSKLLSLRGKRQVGSLSSAERGVLVMVEICMSSTGLFMPPTFIFPRARAKPELLDEAPPGSKAYYHTSGWMQSNIFVSWLDQFIQFSNPSNELPVLLLLDGHTTHTKSLEAIEKARKNNIVMLCFPPHTTHRLQPLDVSFMSPMSTYYTAEVQKWLQQHPGRCVTISQIGKLFGAAFMKAASVQTAVNGFKKTGINPLNSDVFEDWMFEPAETTNRQFIENDVRGNAGQIPLPQQDVHHVTPRRSSTPLQPIHHQEIHHVTPPRPTTPLEPAQGCSLSISTKQFYGTSSFTITPETIVPVPHNERQFNSNDRRRGKTAILTSTPYKDELQEAIENRKGKKKPKLNIDVDNEIKKDKGKLNKQKVEKKIPKSKKVKKKIDKTNKTKKVEESSSEEENDDELCLYCTELYSNSKSHEGWIKCQHCGGWAHEACAGVETDDTEVFSCDFCNE